MTAIADLPGQLSPSREVPELSPKRMWTGLAVVLAAMIMNLLDSTIVNVAAPSIQRDLGMSSSALEWIAAAYTLAIAIGLMTGGRLGDMFGRKPMLMTGLSGFVLSSAACAVAWSPASLITARVLQGADHAAAGPAAPAVPPGRRPGVTHAAGLRPAPGAAGRRGAAGPGRRRGAGPRDPAVPLFRSLRVGHAAPGGALPPGQLGAPLVPGGV